MRCRMRSFCNDNFMDAPQLTSAQKAASDWANANWHEGLKIAGADSNYVAFWAFCAGVEYAAFVANQQQAKTFSESVAGTYRD